MCGKVAHEVAEGFQFESCPSIHQEDVFKGGGRRSYFGNSTTSEANA